MKKKKHGRPSKPSPDQLEVQATKHLEARRFKDALTAYKQLLKQEPRAEWQECLRQAYRGRTRQLADKGMYVEAVTLWEHMETAYGRQTDIAGYFDWLIQAGQAKKAFGLYAGRAPELDTANARTIDSQLAAILLGSSAAEVSACTALLPDDHPLLRDLPLARAALEGYCTATDDVMEAQLKQISFRSPYRDLRATLKALTAIGDPACVSTDIQQLVKPVATTSGFAQLAEVALQAIRPDTDILKTLMDIPSPGLDVLAVLKGWVPGRLNAARELLRQGGSAKALFNFVIDQRADLGQAYAAQVARALLPAYPPGMPLFEKQFGRLPPAERLRFDALTAERREQDDPRDICSMWEEYADELYKAMVDGIDPENNKLKIALVLRHIVDLRQRFDGPSPDSSQAISCLAGSLKLDPEDKASYLRLIRLLQKQKGARKDYHTWVDRAAKQFPEDGEILTTAAEVANSKGAFKKAAQTARKLLKLDPVNSRARHLLISSHLGAARKLLSKRDWIPALKELDQATAAERQSAKTGEVTLLRGITSVLAGQEDEGKKFLQCAVEEVKSALVARLQIFVNVGQIGVTGITLRRLKDLLPPMGALEPRDILRLLPAMESARESVPKALQQALDELVKPLREAARLPYSEQEMATICASFHRLEHFDLLKAYADRALKEWQQHPAFTFYQIYARTKGQAHKLKDREMFLLEDAADEAAARNNIKINNLIIDFLDSDIFDADFDGTPMPGGLPLSPAEVKKMEQMLEELGPEGVINILQGIVGDGGPPFDEGSPFDFSKPPGTPGARRSKPKPKSRQSAIPNKKPDEDNESDNDDSSQGSLF